MKLETEECGGKKTHKNDQWEEMVCKEGPEDFNQFDLLKGVGEATCLQCLLMT